MRQQTRHRLCTRVLWLLVAAVLSRFSDGHDTSDKMNKVKAWFDHGSISSVQKVLISTLLCACAQTM
jgi:hypothetical protein